ncbi:MAG: Crp/Fnr family transcriptional regulator [Hyphomonadaceae bacterium]
MERASLDADSIVRFRANDTIWRPEDVPDRILVIATGWAYRFHRLQEGSRQVLRFLIPGDVTPITTVVGDDEPLGFGVRAVTDLTAYSLEASRFRKLIFSSPKQRDALLHELCEQIRDLENRVTDLGLRSSPSRVARLLLDIEARLSARGLSVGHSFRFPVRQEDFARALGLTPVHANRTLVQMRRKGCIEYRRGVMTLLDMPALERLASEVTVTFAR